jgi:CubicO group peptidase (beta-lactamase class C family)
MGPGGPSLAAVPDLDAVDAVARESRFSGVVRVDLDGAVWARAYGLAHRGQEIPNTVTTRFGIASGGKGLTALTVASLIEDGVLRLDTPAREVLGADLPLIDDAVTVEHLLAHRSGIGDYLDEDDDRPITDYVLPVPVHTLASTEDYLAVLDGHPQVFPPGTRFAYCNSGFVVLALIAERAAAVPFADLVRDRACAPAGMTATAFLRSDEPAADVALGYLGPDGLRTNVFHLPVRGSGDGGPVSTAADGAAFWTALFGGRILPEERVAELVRPRSDVPRERARYGLGFWLHATTAAVYLEGYDAGASFRSVHDPAAGLTWTVLSNTTDGAWPIVRRLQEVFRAA